MRELHQEGSNDMRSTLLSISGSHRAIHVLVNLSHWSHEINRPSSFVYLLRVKDLGGAVMAHQITVRIVHSSPVIREGISDLLNRQPDVCVAGTFGGAREILHHPPERDHVLLYDLATALQDGPALVTELRRRLPLGKILIFNVADNDRAIIECVRAGAFGCVLQDAALEDLVAAIRSVALGAPHMSPRVITSLFSYVASLQAGEDRPPSIPLTGREEQILQLIAEGLSNKEIAQRLFLQPQTVKNYVHTILQKLDLHSRLDVIRSLRSAER
jgi:DNA-binding NarL/FixJ family response regulator